MSAEYATADDFRNWKTLAKKATLPNLVYIILDCRAASLAMKGHNSEKELFYKDQGMTYSDELVKRVGIEKARNLLQ